MTERGFTKYLPLLAGVALAAQPVPLSDVQMDAISAGQVFEDAFKHPSFRGHYNETHISDHLNLHF